MKNIIITGLIAISMIACSAGKETNKQVEPEKVEVEITEVDANMDENGAVTSEGIIRDKSADKCGFVIEIFAENEVKFLEPTDLPSTLKQDGLKVRVTYRMSRRQSTCLLAVPIIIDKISAID